MSSLQKLPSALLRTEWEAADSAAPDPAAAGALPADEPLADLCLVCGDLLAWHEQACPAPPPAAGPSAPVLPRPAGTFTYELGHRVQPLPAALVAQVIWRGQLRERHPGTGLVHRVNVYRLNDGHWDCYREDELQAA